MPMLTHSTSEMIRMQRSSCNLSVVVNAHNGMFIHYCYKKPLMVEVLGP